MYDEYKIYGPYTRSDGRQHIIAVKDGVKKTISYPKFLIENKIGRYLQSNEIIHHKDENPLNNEWSNLEIKLRGEHSRQHSIKYESESFKCPICNKQFILKGKQISKFNRNKKYRNSKGPFCSKSCSGKYGKQIQMGVSLN